MKLLSALVLFVVLCLETDRSLARAGETNRPAESVKSERYEERSKAINELRNQRKTTIFEFTDILQGPYLDQVKRDAAKALGIMRAAEAAMPLADNIHLDVGIRSVIRDFPVPQEDLFPVSTALERVGKPSVAPLISKLGRTDVADERARCLVVVLTIEGREVAASLLAEAFNEATKPEVRARYEIAIQLLPKLQPERAPKNE